jgi:hypothetical protein
MKAADTKAAAMKPAAAQAAVDDATWAEGLVGERRGVKCGLAYVLAGLLAFGCLTGASGCGAVVAPWLGPRSVRVPAAKSIDNPLLLAVADREMLWDQVVDELDDYFRIAREQRIQETGGVLTEGRIDTHPAIGATLLEPWRRDSTPGFERLEATLQSIRRRAIVRVIPGQGGYYVEVQVIKELEDVSQPDRATAASPTRRYDGSLVRGNESVQGGPQTLGWITLGRDVSLEQQILAELAARLR